MQGKACLFYMACLLVFWEEYIPKEDYFQATKHSVPTRDKSDNTNASELRVVTYTCTVLIFWLLWFFIASFWTDDPNL